ncbi:MAG: hypothetical protein ACSHX8_06570 [Opitutaceae bacterium]
MDLEEWSSTSITAAVDGSLEMEVPIVSGEDNKFYRFAYGVLPEM